MKVKCMSFSLKKSYKPNILTSIDVNSSAINFILIKIEYHKFVMYSTLLNLCLMFTC